MKKTFTLTEIIIIVVILGIFATLAIPAYNNLIEDSKAKVCETNLKVLLGVTEIYAREHDRLPASLSELKGDAIRKAWADILKKEGSWKIYLAYFLIDFDRRGIAYAQEGPWLKSYVGNPQNLICPADTDGYPSYGINDAVKNQSLRDYEANLDQIIIADADSTTFATPVARHKHYTIITTEHYAQGIDKQKKVKKKPGGGTP